MNRTRSAVAFCVLLAFAIGSELAAQVTVQQAEILIDRLDGQTVPVRLTLVRDAADMAPPTSALWVFGRVEVGSGDWRDMRWASTGHVGRSSGGQELQVIPATGGPFIPGVLVESRQEEAAMATLQLELMWDFSTSEIEIPEGGYPLMVLAIDMVRVPEGAFALGDGTSSEVPSSLYGSDGAPLRIESEDAIVVGSGADLDYAVSDYGGDGAGPIPDAFPKGYMSFYAMRHELTDGQYAAFLHTLSGRARATRDITKAPGYHEAGGSIRVEDGVHAEEPHRPASFVTWADGTAWAAWAGLRPMTELEFEKLAREPGHYGAEAIIGGRWERTVSIGTPEGRGFRGSHGLGFVDTLGQPYVFSNFDWPGPMALGSGFRGGADGLDDLSSAGNRVFAAYDATYGGESEGFRAVRTAPARPNGTP